MTPKIHPIALTIAGSDSGGGAGIQADLKTFAALGVHGTSAITCITAQNPLRVLKVSPCAPAMVRAQLNAIFAELAPGAAKTGLLCSEEIVREVARFFKNRPEIPLVVDPVMVATSGRRLLTTSAARAVLEQLLPLAALVTPNLAEAEAILGRRIHSVEDLRAVARSIYEIHGCTALVKGGHLPGTNEAIDFLHGREGEWMLSAPRMKGVRLHGTGCTFSAAITAWLARGKSLEEAVRRAKDFISTAISRCASAGKFAVYDLRFNTVSISQLHYSEANWRRS